MTRHRNLVKWLHIAKMQKLFKKSNDDDNGNDDNDGDDIYKRFERLNNKFDTRVKNLNHIKIEPHNE